MFMLEVLLRIMCWKWIGGDKTGGSNASWDTRKNSRERIVMEVKLERNGQVLEILRKWTWHSLMLDKMTGRCLQIFERMSLEVPIAPWQKWDHSPNSFMQTEPLNNECGSTMGWADLGGHEVLVITGPHGYFKKKFGQVPVRDAVDIPIWHLA